MRTLEELGRTARAEHAGSAPRIVDLRARVRVRRRRHLWTGAIAGIAAAAVVAGLAVRADTGRPLDVAAVEGTSSSTTTEGCEAAMCGTDVSGIDVVVDHEAPEGIEVTTTPARPAPAGWFEHEVRVRNGSSRPIHLDDARDAVLVGADELLVADDGCGYGSAVEGTVVAACRSSYRPITLAPGAVATYRLTVWKDLPGMNPAAASAYELVKTIPFRGSAPFGPTDRRSDGAIEVRIAYRFDSSSAPGASGD